MGRILKRRLKDAGRPPIFSPYSVRVLVITDSLSRNVPLEDVQNLAGHAIPRTTQLYDRRRQRVSGISWRGLRCGSLRDNHLKGREFSQESPAFSDQFVSGFPCVPSPHPGKTPAAGATEVSASVMTSTIVSSPQSPQEYTVPLSPSADDGTSPCASVLGC